MKRVLSFLLPIAAVAALAFPAMLQAANLDPVDSAGVQVQQQQQNGINYLSGGIGLDESKAIQQSTGYNLHMTFAVGAQDQYTADVDVMIEKSPGQTVLTLTQTGPLVYVQLPPGKYTVVATRNGETRRDVTDIGSGAARNLVFHWNDAG
ncbi:Carboxypeptidase regulatory-like domain-containing protein [Pseudomonas sp. IT-93MI4]|uniref:carboxypeptidase regulatory-like domain-containing protein n=1 Tax=Pseudomonas sp. IT-93MI4 TaxID=3026441 RepID=UPI0039DF3EDE